MIVRRKAGLHRRFVAATHGVAAIEFAIILPILVTLFLASVDAARAIAIYTKLRAATYVLDAITNQYTTIQSADMSTILGATSVVLAPYSSSPVTVVLSQRARIRREHNGGRSQYCRHVDNTGSDLRCARAVFELSGTGQP